MTTFKHSFFSYFKSILDFIKWRSTFLSSGIITKICKVKTIVLKKHMSQMSMLKSRDPSIDFCGTPYPSCLKSTEWRTYFNFLWCITKVIIDKLQCVSIESISLKFSNEKIVTDAVKSFWYVCQNNRATLLVITSSFHFYIMTRRRCWVLKPLRKAHGNLKKYFYQNYCIIDYKGIFHIFLKH